MNTIAYAFVTGFLTNSAVQMFLLRRENIDGVVRYSAYVKCVTSGGEDACYDLQDRLDEGEDPIAASRRWLEKTAEHRHFEMLTPLIVCP